MIGPARQSDKSRLAVAKALGPPAEVYDQNRAGRSSQLNHVFSNALAAKQRRAGSGGSVRPCIFRESLGFHFERIFRYSTSFIKGAKFYRTEGDINLAAFELHQSVESAYSALLLTLTNYSPPSHNLKFLRGLAEDQDRRLIDVWPRDQHRYTAWYTRYSKHFEITEEALAWLLERTEHLHQIVAAICKERLSELERASV